MIPNFLFPSINCIFGKLQNVVSLLRNKVQCSLKFQSLIYCSLLFPSAGRTLLTPPLVSLSPGIGQSGEGRDQCISLSTAVALSHCPRFSGHGGRAISVSSKRHECPSFPAETLRIPPSLPEGFSESIPHLASRWESCCPLVSPLG